MTKVKDFKYMIQRSITEQERLKNKLNLSEEEKESINKLKHSNDFEAALIHQAKIEIFEEIIRTLPQYQ